MTLYIVRHQESFANANEIISGKYYDFPLTLTGIKNSYNLAEKIYDIPGYKKLVLSSPFIRAKQTAEIIAEKLSIPIIIDPSIHEVDPGIIQGPKSKGIYPKYSDVWEQRGDLDKIPKAEKGNEIQARTIYFLERYLNPRDSEIIVSHAGFNKSLVNTVLGNNRTDFLDVSYDKIHILDDIWNRIEYEKLILANSSETYFVKTKEDYYVLKKSSGINIDQLRLQKEISDFAGVEFMPRVFYHGIKEDYAVQVLNYFKGMHKYGSINKREELIYSVYLFSERIKNFPEKLENFFENVITSLVNSIEDSYLKRYGRILVDNERFRNITNQNKQVLVHYDLHRSNIIFTNEGIRFLDLGAFMSAPEQFQPASFFMASLLLEELKDFNLEKTLSSWPKKNLSREEIIIFMKARALMGCAFFHSLKNKSSNEEDIHERYLKSMSILDNI